MVLRFGSHSGFGFGFESVAGFDVEFGAGFGIMPCDLAVRVDAVDAVVRLPCALVLNLGSVRLCVWAARTGIRTADCVETAGFV